MSTIGYGEDGLTYWALHSGRAALLHELGDDTPVDQCLVYFRPSFGRSGGPNKPAFGEFDAILCTPTQVYLIESKWDGGGVPRGVVVLQEVQRLRHMIFTWLYENWSDLFKSAAAPTWAAFVQAKGEAFTQEFPNRPLASPKRLLSRNLCHILEQVSKPRRSLRNVLLYFHRPGFQRPARIVSDTGQPVSEPRFELVMLSYQPFGNSGFFQM